MCACNAGGLTEERGILYLPQMQPICARVMLCMAGNDIHWNGRHFHCKLNLIANQSYSDCNSTTGSVQNDG